MNKIDEVKKKKEFSGLPDSIVKRALLKCEEDVKEARAYLHKYFGLFLRNKVVKGKGEEVLENHISSKGRNYEELYGHIFGRKNFESVIDLGCGVNGLSFSKMLEYGVKSYVGVEASKQIVDIVNNYFEEKNINGVVEHGDLFDLKRVNELMGETLGPKIVFIFQVVDALEGMKKNFSKELLKEIKSNLEEGDRVVLSVSIRSISGRKKFGVERKWLKEYIGDEFKVIDDFELGTEEFIVFSKG